MSKRPDILKCKCGSTPILRYRSGLTWIECKCGRKSSRFLDGYEQVDPDAVWAAIEDWNERHGRKDEQDN